MGMTNGSLIAGIALLFTSCATMPEIPEISQTLPPSKSAPVCENEVAEIRADHTTARLNLCDVISSNSFAFTIRPEAKTGVLGVEINNSAWYGFRVDPKDSGNINITLKYENGKHRYRPKKSFDGVNWQVLPASFVTETKEDMVELNLTSDGRSFFISGQEIFTAQAHDLWTAKTAQSSIVKESIFGKSRNGYPLRMLEVQSDPDVKKPYVVWVGRQHPPEVTGALALIPFTETVLGDTVLAQEFLDHFNLLIIPMINPDGVGTGNWRFNDGRKDLNRDWGTFSQPEIQAVRDAFARFRTVDGSGGDDRVAFFLDFHSTHRNLLYTQTDDEPTSPPMFARDWLKAVDDRLDDNVYAFTREARPNSGRPISKNYMYDTYGISSITFEVGDETNRDAIKVSAQVFAEEMMSLLLVHKTGQWSEK
jgi:hypothetical protein